ncbi:MAG: ROK family transcriptional regulator [Gammaproteobacteria bacterium]|nr:ROK family transcriptional regulator [Gammaproteobacteria bacterium]
MRRKIKYIKQGGGANQSTLRRYNERAILSLIRRHGPLAKAELAKLTGLSAQSMSVIMRGLEQEGLLLRGKSLKGKVGQPSVPMALNPDGVFTLGLKIGRRRAEIVLMDFSGDIRCSKFITYLYPVTENIIAFAQKKLPDIIAYLSTDQRKKILGLGIAMPDELWNWSEEIGAPQQDIDSWHQIDLADEIGKFCTYPITIQNDTTAACGAELIFGLGSQLTDFSYIFIGFFIGGGLVLNHSIFSGPQGNAGAIGSMPIIGPDGKLAQLIDHASVALLEKQLKKADISPEFLWQSLNDWRQHETHIQHWIDYIAKYIAIAIVSSCSVIDFKHVVIDGAFPANIRGKIVAAIAQAVQEIDLQGIVVPSVKEATINHDPRVVGSACLPLFEHYLLDQSLLFKS